MGETFARLSPERQRDYASGMAQAYGDVFGAFTEEIGKTVTGSTAAERVLARVQVQWREVEAMIAVEGTLE